MKKLLFLSSALLLLSACGSKPTVYDVNGDELGKITVTSNVEARFVDSTGRARGRVRGEMVRDGQGKHIGDVRVTDIDVLLFNTQKSPIGSLESGRDCHARDGTLLGNVQGSDDLDPHMKGAACLAFFFGRDRATSSSSATQEL